MTKGFERLERRVRQGAATKQYGGSMVCTTSLGALQLEPKQSQTFTLLVKLEVDGLDVHFPVAPLDAQHVVMATAVRAMSERRVAFVESPTGMGVRAFTILQHASQLSSQPRQ